MALVLERLIIQPIKVKKLSMDNIKSFRDKFNIPVTDDEIESIPYVRPAEDSPEIQYLKKTRESLGGPIPRRRNTSKILPLT
jgi:pyruvate dehydrogenase E1 component